MSQLELRRQNHARGRADAAMDADGGRRRSTATTVGTRGWTVGDDWSGDADGGGDEASVGW